MYNMIEVRFVDINGRLKAMNCPLEKPVDNIQDVKKDPIFIEGVNIDGSSVPGFTPLENSDLHLKPISETLIDLPYTSDPKLGVMCEITQAGKIFAGDTRSQLVKVIRKHLEPRGWKLKIGPEPEFYLLKDGESVDNGKYADVFPDSISAGMIRRFSRHMNKAGLVPRVHHHEVGPGQYEVEIGFMDAVRIADAIVTYKAMIRALAYKNGHVATFMPKPFYGKAGNGMHFHTSLWQGSDNLFGKGKANEISQTGQHFMAGIIAHAQALTAIVAPTINSYKRLVPGYEAPVYVAWAPLNRSALIRIPEFRNPSMARFEYRCPDPSTNPYLAFAALIVAGIDGIERELELAPPVARNIYKLSPEERQELLIQTLPGNLFEAVNHLKQDTIIREALGHHIFSEFVKAKKREWEQYSTQVTDWDWINYLNV
ncbi:MAG: glutamine synthetase family protein [Candidatus Heimdallarchaeota archaeon]